MKCSRLWLLVVLVMLAAGATQALAQPVITGYQITHGTAGTCGYFQRVCVYVSDPDGYDGAGAAALLPGSSEWISLGCVSWDAEKQAQCYAGRACWLQEVPPLGAYQVKATGPGGAEAILTTGETTTFPTDPFPWAAPMPGAVFESATPLLSWNPYVFPGDAPDTPGGQLGMVQVWGIFGSGNTVSRDCLQGEAAAGATGWQYNPGFDCAPTTHAASLDPGHTYQVSITLASVGHALANNGWYTEMVTTGGGQAIFTIDGPTPALETVSIFRGVSVYPDGRHVYGETCLVSGTDLNGGENLKIVVHDPPNAFRKQVATYHDTGFYGVLGNQYWSADQLTEWPKNDTGSYLIALTDSVTDQQVESTYSYSQPLAAPVITAPLNGAIVTAGSNPTFAWTAPADLCSIQVFVEEVPGDGSGCDYRWRTSPGPTFPEGRLVWGQGLCLPGDATSVDYTADGSGEALLAGHQYRVHVMANSGDPGSLLTVSDAMVDFVVH